MNVVGHKIVQARVLQTDLSPSGIFRMGLLYLTGCELIFFFQVKYRMIFQGAIVHVVLMI